MRTVWPLIASASGQMELLATIHAVEYLKHLRFNILPAGIKVDRPDMQRPFGQYDILAQTPPVQRIEQAPMHLMELRQ